MTSDGGKGTGVADFGMVTRCGSKRHWSERGAFAPKARIDRSPHVSLKSIAREIGFYMAAPVIPPPLCDGERMSRDEFLRRWELLPGLKHAQLLDGIVYMASPVSAKHGTFHNDFVTWLGTYKARTPGCDGLTDATALMESDAPQPDIALRVLPSFGGQSRNEGAYLAGAPELIVEVAASSRARDLGPKSQLYLKAGVREYLSVLVEEERIIWRELYEDTWRDIASDGTGILRSRVFPGLWLDEPAMWRRDLAQVLDVLGQGMASAEYTAFAQSLAVRGHTAQARDAETN